MAESYSYKCFFVNHREEIIRVLPDDIYYIESIRNHCLIYWKGQPAKLTMFISIQEMEQLLCEEEFMRVHKSYIVALKPIKKMNSKRTRLYICGEDPVPVGETYRERFIQWFDKVNLLSKRSARNQGGSAPK